MPTTGSLKPVTPAARRPGATVRPELGPKAGHQVDATDRRARLAQAGDPATTAPRVGTGQHVELEIGV